MGEARYGPLHLYEGDLEGKPIEVYNHGKMRRDFTYVDDIVEGVIRTLDHPAHGESSLVR